MRGRTRGFAPHAERPDQVVNRLQSDLSLWVLGAVFMVAGLGAYLGFRTALSNETGTQMAAFNDLVKLPPKAAHVTITLP
jgi:type VI secretion system protein ImpK